MIRQLVFNRLSEWSQKREPFCIGGKANPYMKRWYVIPRNLVFNIYFHQILKDDNDEALHDHPWLFNISWILKGSYWEVLFKVKPKRSKPLPNIYAVYCPTGFVGFRWARKQHRLMLTIHNGVLVPCYSLFITGPKLWTWGFYCSHPNGSLKWVPWQKFTAGDRGELVGKGCDA